MTFQEEKKRPIIIAFEGHDGVGKTTQSLLLDARLKSIGLMCSRVKMPMGSGFFGAATIKLISFMAKSGLALSFPNVFNVLHFVNKLSSQSYIKNVDKDVIIFDRWKMSAVVYGQAMGASTTLNDRFSTWLMEPDVTIVLVSNRKRDKGDTLDMNCSLQQTVKTLYEYGADSQKSSVIVINSDAGIMDVHKRIVSVVSLKTALKQL